MNRDAYLKAILTEPGDVTLYHNSAYFKVALDNYIAMIPIFVDGLRQHAEIEDRKIRNYEKMMRTGLSGYPALNLSPSEYYGPGGLGYPDDR